MDKHNTDAMDTESERRGGGDGDGKCVAEATQDDDKENLDLEQIYESEVAHNEENVADQQNENGMDDQDDTADTDESTRMCALCFARFSITVMPKLLPCGHLVCRVCLLSTLQVYGKKTECPTCPCYILEAVPLSVLGNRKAANYEAVVDSLPLDLAMLEMVSTQGTKDKKEEQQQKQANCCVCEDRVASAVCLDCLDKYCDSCTRIHLKMSATKGHTLQVLPEVGPPKPAKEEDSLQEEAVNNIITRCTKHVYRPSKFFCMQHNVFLCLHCTVAEQHRSCRRVSLFREEESTTWGFVAEMQNLTRVFKSTVAKQEKMVGDIENLVSKVKENVGYFMMDAKAIFDRLETAVKECRTRFTDSMAKALNDCEESSETSKNFILWRKGKMLQHTQLLKRVWAMKPGPAADIMMEIVKTRIQDLDCGDALPAEGKTLLDLNLVKNMQLLGQVERDVVELARLNVVYASISFNQYKHFCFSHRHGSGIALSNNNKTASRVSGGEASSRGVSCVVMSSDPMDVDRLYEVQINKAIPYKAGMDFVVGISLSSPSRQFKRPGTPLNNIITIGTTDVHFFDVKGASKAVPNPIGKKVRNVPAGTRVGLRLDKSRALFLYRDGECQGFVASQIEERAYPTFELNDSYTEITTMCAGLLTSEASGNTSPGTPAIKSPSLPK